MRESGMQYHGSGSSFGHFSDTIWRPLMKSPARPYALFSIFFVLVFGALISTRLLNSSTLAATNLAQKLGPSTGTPTKIYSDPNATNVISGRHRNKLQFPLNCSHLNLTRKCPREYPKSSIPSEDSPASTCPEYFHWIHEDLRPWAHTGITLDMVLRARQTANFRLVVVDGRPYIETYQKSFQTRDIFTMWGILQLLRRYPGKIPDLDLMFDCVDWPVIKQRDFSAPDAPVPPPLFRYCSDEESLDIVFPDWTFWGWPETNIKPWESLLEDLREGSQRTKWIHREPYAYWKGNPDVAETRKDLLKCNLSQEHDWNARIYRQDWVKESHEGYKSSNLASQCTYRYKIYIEGSAWSVSEKYILSCDSVTLLVKPHYFDFFTRSLVPMHHYWPIREDDKCRSLQFAVDWGNNNQQKAQVIGKAASNFIQQELKMNYVYDYMFHLLNQYSKLLRYKPTIPEKALELCSEAMACTAEGLEKKFLLESMVTAPSETSPCTMPPPYDPASINGVIVRKENLISEVELWQKNYWEHQTKPTNES